MLQFNLHTTFHFPLSLQLVSSELTSSLEAVLAVLQDAATAFDAVGGRRLQSADEFDGIDWSNSVELQVRAVFWLLLVFFL